MLTFGNTTTDKVVFTGLATNPFAASRVTLVCAWAYPTTLTSGNILLSSGSVCALAVPATTASLTLTLDATTDGVWTIPVADVVNTMNFIAVLSSQNAAGGTAAVRAWSGPAQGPIVERAVTQTTAPVGAWVASGTGLNIGNTPAGTSPWIGDIGGVVLLSEDRATSNMGPMGDTSAVGTLTQADADAVFQRCVLPIWHGDLPAVAALGRGVYERADNKAPLNGFLFSCSLDHAPAGGGSAIGAWAAYQDTVQRGTVTGATVSTRTTPHHNMWQEMRLNTPMQTLGMRRQAPQLVL